MSTRIAFLVAIVANAVFAAPAPDYLTEVKPLLASRCFDCHGGLKQKAKLRVDTAAAMLEAEVVIPGKPQASELFQRVSTTDLDERMPPEHEGSPFTAKELKILRAWIAAGAPAPDDEEPQISPKDHWAFQRIEQPTLPRDDIANPIDAFLTAKHAEHGLKPQPEADRRILLRRLYLDLIGLPPTLEQLRDRRPWKEVV
ncbi:MAG: c-type cytochrome domain-containing protein, partial [Limisphaerales bacterium]